jgi:hypothetical protein
VRYLAVFFAAIELIAHFLGGDGTMQDAKDYEFWRAALRGEKQPVQEGNLQCGFYKRRLVKDGEWLPIAFWRNNEDQIVCCFDGKLVDPLQHWIFAAKYAVSEASYRHYVRNGHWPDDVPQSPRSNVPSDPFEALKLEVEDKLEQAQNRLRAAPKVLTETDASMARNMQAALLQLNRRADAMHKIEKQPHLDASRAVDAKFDFRKAVATVADRLRDVFTTFMRAEEARQRAAAQKRFEEELRTAEEARKAAEEERERLQNADPALAFITEPQTFPELPVAPEPVKVQVGGGFGRKAGLKTVYIGKILDWQEVLQHFSGHQQVRDLLQKLVDADVRLNKAQCAIPGVEVLEERVAA